MVTSEREIMEFIEEYDVKFIRLAFFDLFGNQKNISIMPRELKQVFAHGLSFDASAVSGFSQESQFTEEHFRFRSVSVSGYLHTDHSSMASADWACCPNVL